MFGRIEEGQGMASDYCSWFSMHAMIRMTLG